MKSIQHLTNASSRSQTTTSSRITSRRWSLSFAISLSLLTSSAIQTPAAEKEPQLVKAITEAADHNQKQPSDSEDETFNAWSFATHPNDTKAGIRGVTALWSKGQLRLVELAWWHQKNPEVRKCILLLFYSLTKEELSNFPDFTDHATRFAKPEAQARASEIEEIKKIANESRPKLEEAFLPK
jgi:hypothetical protein